jgi:creatinine amidohydrolase
MGGRRTIMGTKMLEEMSWEQFDRARKEIVAALIPIGSVEEEGPHLPLGVDTIVAVEVAKKVALQLPVIILPAVSIGYSEWHKGFPGTLSLSISTLTQMLREICEDLVEQGLNRIVFINPHVGNETPIMEVAVELRMKSLARVAMFHLWAIANEMAKDVGGLVEKKFAHAGEMMTSVMLALRPDLVNMERAIKEFERTPMEGTKQEGSLKILFKNRHINFYCLSKEVTNSGVMGDPSHATREKGEIIVKGWVDYICDFIQEFKEVSI